MNQPNITDWLALLEAGCAEVPITWLDLIVDQAGGRPLLASTRSVQPALACQLLFKGLPEESAEDLAPLLIRIDLQQPIHRQWLHGLLQECAGNAQILALACTWPLEVLARYLGRCLEARNGGQLGLLRYYDPRVFPALFSQVLAPEQQRELLRPAVFWSWLDRDGQPRQLPGLGEEEEAAPDFQQLELSDAQRETLGCASEAGRLLDSLRVDLPTGALIEPCFSACYAALLAATEAGVIADSQREAFALQRLSAAIPLPTITLAQGNGSHA
jgi:hypothetical protein